MKILYIGSAGRSGSTLLDLMLGQGEGMFSTGEVRYLWDRGYLANELCGCGDPFRRCLFWQRVTEQAFGSFAEAERAAAYFSEHAPVRWRQLPMLMNLWGNPEANGHLGALTETLGKVYAAIQQVSGASVIVDSSKLITCGLILNRIPNVDISVLHLVRDSRAVAYSWQRKKLRPEIHWKQEYMPKCSPFESSRDWMMFNLMTRRLISEVGKPSLFLRYEDAVANPDAMTRRVQSFFAQQGTHVEFPSYESGVIRVLTNHTVAGNPIRLGRDEIRLRADMEWREKMDPRQKRMVTALTAPLLSRYGYIDSFSNAMAWNPK